MDPYLLLVILGVLLFFVLLSSAIKKIKNSNNPFVGYLILTAILIFLLLPFHFFPGGLRVFPKDHFTFNNTLILQEDIDKLVERFNNSTPFEQAAMNNEPFMRTLREQGLIHDKTFEELEKERRNKNQ